MKKLVVLFFTLFSISSALAADPVPGMPTPVDGVDTSDYGILVYALASDVVKQELEFRDIKSIDFEKVNAGTWWSYTIQIKTTEAGLGMDGPSSHPCFTTVKVDTIGGWAGTEVGQPTAETVCAAN